MQINSLDLRYFSSVCDLTVNANWHSFNPKITHADPCGRSIENNYVKASATLTEWSSQISAGARKKIGDGAERDRAWRAAETADQSSKRLRNWGWGTVPNVLLKLWKKIHFTAEKYVNEGKWNLWGERNEVRADERQTGSGKLRGERLKITADK